MNGNGILHCRHGRAQYSQCVNLGTRTAIRSSIISGLALLMAGVALGRAASAPASRPVSFARDILPILSDNCLHCHGLDEHERKGKLRLDTHEGALAKGKSGEIAIVPGNSAASEVFRRITTQDEDELMPPPKSNRKLTPAQVALLKRWIDEGAKWGQHWAFEPPVRPAVPKVQGSKSWAQNPIDAFVLAKLQAEKLEPAPEADRRTLLRRVTLDLVGVPPTPAEVDAAGGRTEYRHDLLGRPIEVIDAAGGITRFAHDEAGNRIAQTDAEGRTTRFEYDAAGRLVARIP